MLRNDDCELGLLFSLRCSLMRLMKLSRGRRGAESMKLKEESRRRFGLSWIIEDSFSQWSLSAKVKGFRLRKEDVEMLGKAVGNEESDPSFDELLTSLGLR